MFFPIPEGPTGLMAAILADIVDDESKDRAHRTLPGTDGVLWEVSRATTRLDH